MFDKTTVNARANRERRIAMRQDMSKSQHAWELFKNVPRSISSANEIELKKLNCLLDYRHPREIAEEFSQNLGQEDAEFLIEHPEETETFFRGKGRIVFPGTVWRNRVGSYFVPCIVSWEHNEPWKMEFKAIQHIGGFLDWLPVLKTVKQQHQK